jgi:hypothetical protein
MSEFSDSDYSGIMFPIHKHPIKGKDYLTLFPDLNLYPEFSVDLLPPFTRNQILAYCVYCYDKESPYRKKYPDLDIRRYKIGLEIGFDMTDSGKFQSYVEEIFDGQNQVVNDMIICYVKIHYNTKYAFFVMMEALFFTNLKTAVAGLGANKMVELKQIQEAMENAQRELLAFDNNKELIKALYKRVHIEKIDMSPETVAKKLKEGKPIFEE